MIASLVVLRCFETLNSGAIQSARVSTGSFPFSTDDSLTTPKSPPSPAVPGSTRALPGLSRTGLYRAGIHPQCAVKQASAARSKPIRPGPLAEVEPAKDGNGTSTSETTA